MTLLGWAATECRVGGLLVMARVRVFGDESGDFKFGSEKQGTSRYFLVTTVTLTDYAVVDALIALRRELIWEGRTDPGFHANKNPPPLRRRVFAAIEPYDFRIDATLLTKTNAHDRIRSSNLRFWKTNWYYHLRHVIPAVATEHDELLVVSASIETKMKPSLVREALTDVVQQVSPTERWHAAVWPAHAETGLQLADYCAWAIARKWESGNTDYYDLIAEKVRTEYKLF